MKKSDKKLNTKPIPKDAVAQGPNKSVLASKLPSDCAN
jgi:hypothetical protein